MSADLLKKLEQRRLGRRSFLRGSGLAVAAFAGVAAVSSLTARAQEPQRPQETKDPKKDEQQGQGQSQNAPKEKLDAEGREYRNCPQCGQNMYREGRTWSCETCGYSYVE